MTPKFIKQFVKAYDPATVKAFAEAKGENATLFVAWCEGKTHAEPKSFAVKAYTVLRDQKKWPQSYRLPTQCRSCWDHSRQIVLSAKPLPTVKLPKAEVVQPSVWEKFLEVRNQFEGNMIKVLFVDQPSFQGPNDDPMGVVTGFCAGLSKIGLTLADSNSAADIGVARVIFPCDIRDMAVVGPPPAQKDGV